MTRLNLQGQLPASALEDLKAAGHDAVFGAATGVLVTTEPRLDDRSTWVAAATMGLIVVCVGPATLDALLTHQVNVRYAAARNVRRRMEPDDQNPELRSEYDARYAEARAFMGEAGIAKGKYALARAEGMAEGRPCSTPELELEIATAHLLSALEVADPAGSLWIVTAESVNALPAPDIEAAIICGKSARLRRGTRRHRSRDDADKERYRVAWERKRYLPWSEDFAVWITYYANDLFRLQDDHHGSLSRFAFDWPAAAAEQPAAFSLQSCSALGLGRLRDAANSARERVARGDGQPEAPPPLWHLPGTTPTPRGDGDPKPVLDVADGLLLLLDACLAGEPEVNLWIVGVGPGFVVAPIEGEVPIDVPVAVLGVGTFGELDGPAITRRQG